MSKTILITGANRGIGLEFVKQYLALGYRVLACCRHPEKAEALNQLAKANAALSVYPLDVSEMQSIQALAILLKNESIDILMNNAGVSGVDQPLGKIQYEDLLSTLKINSIAPIMMIQAFTDLLLKGQRKLVVNISSTLGSIELNQDTTWPFIPYRVSKSALNSATKALSNHLKEKGITVISMHPGWVKTDMGGQNADITVEKSVSGILSVLETVSLSKTGSFLTYEGKVLPW